VDGEEKAEVLQVGSKSDPAYRVTGILSSDNVLHLPGGKFGMRDLGKLRAWLDTLADQGVDGVTQRRVMFGLTESQGDRVRADLRKHVTMKTKGQPLSQVVKAIGGQLEFPMTQEPSAAKAMAGVVVEDELQGMGRGTALAMLLRPAGLAFEPERETG